MRTSQKSECKETRDHNCVCHSHMHISHYYISDHIERHHLIHSNTIIVHNIMVTKSTQAPFDEATHLLTWCVEGLHCNEE